jgi:hypothetical protein
MQEFNIYFQLGYKHITDLKGYDHILFIVALCAIYLLTNWRKVAVLVTAFTLGHSITLALATFNIIKLNASFIEFLIPITIIFTAFGNIFSKPPKNGKGYLRYFMALFFGLIHGLGFSNYLRSLLGREATIFKPLFAFNLGLELGQLIIVFITLVLAQITIKVLKINQRDWRMVLSAVVAGMAIVILLNSKYLGIS